MIAIESRMQGDHDELKSLLKKCLISSCFIQKFSLKRRDHQFIDKSSRKMRAFRVAEDWLEDHDVATSRAISGHDPTTWAPLILDLCRLIFIRVSTWSNMSLYYSLSVRLNCECRISLMRLTITKYAHVVDLDHMDRSPRNWHVSIWATWSYASRTTTSPKNQENRLVPHRENEAKSTPILGELVLRGCVAQFGPVCPPMPSVSPLYPLAHTHSPSDSTRHVGVHVGSTWVRVGSCGFATCPHRAMSASCESCTNKPLFAIV